MTPVKLSQGVLLDPETGRPESALVRPRIAPAARKSVTELNHAWYEREVMLAGDALVPRLAGGTVPPTENYATLAETTTTADPGAGGTTLQVASRSAMPQSGQFRVVVQNSETDKTNREVMVVSGGFGSGAGTFNPVARGQEGTVAVAHPSGSYVAHVLTAGALQQYAPRVPNPADHSLLAWSADPAGAFDSSTVTLLTGTLQLVKIMLPFPMTITNVVYAVTVVGATLTSGQSLVGLYDSAGNRQAQSADQSVTWTAVGLKTTAMTGTWTPATTGPGAFCWIVFLSVGTTMPRFAVLNNTANTAAIAAINVGTTTANSRMARNAGGQTSLPASITLGSNANSGVSIWAALS